MNKLLVIAVLFLALPMSLCAQIPNAGFEAWTGTTDLLPDGWTTNNLLGLGTPITRSSTAHSGSFSIQGSVVNVFGSGYPPSITTFFPFTQRVGSLKGFFQFSSVGGDSLIGLVWLYSSGGSGLYAVGSFTAGTANQWTQFDAPIYYTSGADPDSAYIQISITGQDSIHIGSTFLLDDLTLEGTPSSVGHHNLVPTTFALQQNYPNPFNPSTMIEYTVGGVGGQGSGVSVVRLSVYDLLGQEVAVLINAAQAPGTYRVQFDASDLPSGMYFYRLQAGNFSQTRKLMILR